MTVEEKLRAAMHVHDTEAPTQVPWPAVEGRIARRRPTARFALAVAVVAVLAAGGTWLAVAWPRSARTSTPTTTVTPLSCPTGSPSRDATGVPTTTVPAVPTVPDASGYLVPAATPTSAVVCGYRGDVLASTGTHGLTQSAVLTGDLGLIAALHGQSPAAEDQPPCASDLEVTDADDYFIGLTYPDGIVWIHAPGDHCSGASNGVFSTSSHLAPLAATALALGHWTQTAASPVPRPTPSTGCVLDDTRPGVAITMVPDTPSRLTICRITGLVDHAGVVPPDQLGPLVEALNALSTTPEAVRHQCGADVLFVLQFGYATGPDVEVTVADECTPSVDNGALQATATPELMALVRQLSH